MSAHAWISEFAKNLWCSYLYFFFFFLPISLSPSLFCVPACLGLLYAGDKLVEVNGVSVEGLDPEQVIHILVTVFCLPSRRPSAMPRLPWACLARGVGTVTWGGFGPSWQLPFSRPPELFCFCAAQPPTFHPNLVSAGDFSCQPALSASGRLPVSPAQVPCCLGCSFGNWAWVGRVRLRRGVWTWANYSCSLTFFYSWNLFNIFPEVASG